MSEAKYTCPCCGHRTLSEFPGSYEVCEVCFWEDDMIQLLDPAYRGGANGPSLMECQQNYGRLGACEECFLGSVRPPRQDEPRDPEWRPARTSDLRTARRPRDLSEEERTHLETWHYRKRSP